MPLPEFEPMDGHQTDRWLALAGDANDPFRDVRDASDSHREQHRCDLYPSGSGPLLGLLARMARPARVLEAGCGLGYSALWLARGAGPGVPVLTIESDPDHAALARESLGGFVEGQSVLVVEGLAVDVLATMAEPVDFAFFDADPAGSLEILGHFERLVSPGGWLVSSNLFLAQFVPDATWVAELAEYRRRLDDPSRWDTTWLGKAVSRRLS